MPQSLLRLNGIYVAAALTNGAKGVRLNGRLLEGSNDRASVEIGSKNTLVICGRSEDNFPRHLSGLEAATVEALQKHEPALCVFLVTSATTVPT